MSDFETAQRVWAPWRMAFIQAPKEPGCFLCRIAAGGPDEDAENHVVGRRGTALLLLNRYPYNGGHLMAAPVRHVATLAELAPEEMRDLMDLVCRGQRLLAGVMRPEGFNVGINEGAAAGAGLKDHLHVHVVPRWAGDTNFMPVVGGARVVPQALADAGAALRAEWARTEAGA